MNKFERMTEAKIEDLQLQIEDLRTEIDDLPPSKGGICLSDWIKHKTKVKKQAEQLELLEQKLEQTVFDLKEKLYEEINDLWQAVANLSEKEGE